jgi:hypothetical protein
MYGYLNGYTGRRKTTGQMDKGLNEQMVGRMNKQVVDWIAG